MSPAHSFSKRIFKTETWPSVVDGPFDFVLSLQAVHELRHKRHAEHLYRQKGQHSIRINDQYRVCFVWTPLGPSHVQIVDYH